MMDPTFLLFCRLPSSYLVCLRYYVLRKILLQPENPSYPYPTKFNQGSRYQQNLPEVAAFRWRFSLSRFHPASSIASTPDEKKIFSECLIRTAYCWRPSLQQRRQNLGHTTLTVTD